MKKSKRSSLINLLTLLVVTAALAGVVLLINPAGGGNKNSGGDITVQVKIECPDILEEKNYRRLSQSVKDSGLLEGGEVLAEQKVSLSEGGTAMDALKIVCEDKDLALDVKISTVKGVSDYVRGIGGLSEGDCTKHSGWVYYIDGVEPEVGLDDSPLSDGSELRLEYIVY